MDQIIEKSLEDSISVKRQFILDNLQRIKETAMIIAETFRSGGKLLLFGNGGSAADAQHIAAEFVNRFLIEREPLPAVALTTDTSILTSIANDYSFEDVFSKQVKALGRRGDVVLGITTSGNSPNVIKALETAKGIEIKTVVLTGRDGGKVAQIVDIPLIVSSIKVPRIQEAHGFCGHVLCELVDHILFQGPH
ncbi:MAG: D-sedoheptulose 7-phosphate isomerase [Pseudomonadota bacterium]